MPLSLLKLIALQFRGFFRRMLRGARSPRRAVFLLIGFGVIILWLLPSLLTSFALTQHAQSQPHLSKTNFHEVAPLALLGICLMTIISSAGDKAIAFTAGEVDNLFPGPFSRRQLLAYKLLKSSLAALLTTLLFSFILLPYAHSWLSGYVGILLMLLFVQWFSTAGVLLGQALGQRLNSYLRGAALVGVIVLMAIVGRTLASHGGIEAIYRLHETQIGQALLRPFEPFADTIAAWPDGQWVASAAEAMLVDVLLLAIVILLDANYLEAALSASQRRYAQLQRIRSGSLLTSSFKGDVKWHLPRPRWLAGAGPIIWRQATTAARSAKGLLLIMLVIALCVGPVLATFASSVDVAPSLVPALVWMTVLLSGLMKFDFRGDLDHFDSLKSLPLPSVALSLGQIAMPALLLTVFHVIILVGVAIASPGQRGILLVAAWLALPFNALLVASDNLIFLLFPARPAAATPGDFQMMGRQAAQLILKAIIVMIGCIIAFAIAIPFHILTGGSFLVLALLAWTILSLETAALVPAIAKAFRRFDPSLDMPG